MPVFEQYSSFEPFYEQWKFETMQLPAIHPQEVEQAVEHFASNPAVTVTATASSFEGRPISLLSIGHGKQTVFAWSQMHGDEPTATAGLFDLLSLLLAPQLSEFRQRLEQQLTLHVLPMLNPDGAAANTRENAQGIDINRDARAGHSVEGRLLKKLLIQLAPDFTFNLHDQSPYYATGDTSLPATLSFLAPPGDQQETLTPQRKRAMALIGHWCYLLHPQLQGRIGRYCDGYSERAFGDFAAASGASSILVECGAHGLTVNRSHARKYAVWCLLHAFELIVDNTIQLAHEQKYWQLPENRENGLADTLIRSLCFSQSQPYYEVDIAIDVQRLPVARVREIGDLADMAGFQELDATGLYFDPGKVFQLTDTFHLSDTSYLDLLAQGYSCFAGQACLLKYDGQLPVVFAAQAPQARDRLDRRCSATWLMNDTKGPRYAVLDGQLIDIRRVI